ncbi:MAG: hypothetical protein KAV87_05960 [Desulfobacteraceae bacterium]|nr:hypothetical protein [Desulfobacteraceae bacterium]
MEAHVLKYSLKVIHTYKHTKLTREDRYKSFFLNKENYYALKLCAENIGIPMSSALPLLMLLGMEKYAEVMRIVEAWDRRRRQQEQARRPNIE